LYKKDVGYFKIFPANMKKAPFKSCFFPHYNSIPLILQENQNFQPASEEAARHKKH